MTTNTAHTAARSAIFETPHRAEMTGFFFGRDNTRIEVLTFWFAESADAAQAAGDLQGCGCDVRSFRDVRSPLGPHRVVGYRAL